MISFCLAFIDDVKNILNKALPGYTQSNILAVVWTDLEYGGI